MAKHVRTGAVNQHRSFFIYADTSDAGPDQAARRKMLRSALVDVGNILYFDTNCAIHQYHLIVKEQLLAIDSFLKELQGTTGCENICVNKYFASIAKISYFWRERVSAFIEAWEFQFGISTDVAYRRYPLQVVGGRWGSIDAAEDFFLARGKKRLRPVLLALLSRSMKAKKNLPTETEEDLRDCLDDRATYQIKMSKYVSGALSAVQSDLFWLLLRVAHTARSPLRHFFLWCQKYAQRRPLLRLVTGFADRIMDEFNDLYLTLDEWFQSAVDELDAAGIPVDILGLLKSFCLRLLITSAGGFEMRVRAMAYKLLNLFGFYFGLQWLLLPVHLVRCICYVFVKGTQSPKQRHSTISGT